jgi:TatD DNase family protein
MIDTHAHLFDSDFDQDFDQVIGNAFSEGVEAILMPAIEPKTFEKMFDCVSRDKRLFCSIGIHPHNSQELNDETLKLIEDYSNHPKVRAIGEIGLDYYYDFSPKVVQIEAFRKQIEIAKKCDLPIIVHNRESDEDVISIIKEFQDGTLKGVLHCFSGDLHLLESAMYLGFYVSFTGNITFKKADELRKVVAEAPLERILLETDSPWMAPVPMRGRRNEPKLIKLIAEKIADIKSITLEEVINMTTKSAKELFKLTFAVLFIFCFSSLNLLFAQNQNEEEAELTNETGYQYYKLIGIAPIIGTNTVVNTFTPLGEDRSQDGLFTIGAGLFSNPIDWVFVEAAYLHFEDKKPFNETQHELVPLDIEKHNMFELGAGIILNPNGKINFYGVLGYSFVSSKYSRYTEESASNYIKETYTNTRNGIFVGPGFFANIPVDGAGIFVLNAEWRLTFILENTILPYDPRVPYTDPINYNKGTEYSTFFSIPRISIIWYPPLDEWLNLKK